MTAIGTCLMFAERRISSEAAYRAFSHARLQKAGRSAVPQSDPLRVGLDCGVYLAWCPGCRAGVGVDPRWSFAACACGLTWERLEFPGPSLLEQIDAVLSLRPPGTINLSPTRWYSWHPDQSVEDLVRENIRHGWPVPDALAPAAPDYPVIGADGALV